MGVIPVGLKSVKCGLVTGANLVEGLPQAVGHSFCHHLPAVLGDQNDVGMEFIHHMATGSEFICTHIAIVHIDQSTCGRLHPWR